MKKFKLSINTRNKIKESQRKFFTIEDPESVKNLREYQIEDVKKMFERDNFEYLKSNLKTRKTVDFLVENAKLV